MAVVVEVDDESFVSESPALLPTIHQKPEDLLSTLIASVLDGSISPE